VIRVRVVRKPAAARKRTVRVVPPRVVEYLRDRSPTLLDATLISVLAYAGLRPGEALALTWGDVGERTIRVDKALSLGEVRTLRT
jgi:integrase